MMLALLIAVLATAEPVTADAMASWVDYPTGNGPPASNGPRFKQVSAGGGSLSWTEGHTCGVKTDGTVACWGANSFGQATPPGGTFQQVSAGYAHTCGVKTGGEVACWGSLTTAPIGTFQQVSAGGSVKSIEAGGYTWWGGKVVDYTCGVKTDGAVACWGNDEDGKATPPGGTFTQVSAGDNHTCGVRAGGAVACWGNNEYGKATPPGGTFTQVSAGNQHTCGVQVGGAVACWGNNEDGKATPPGGTFAQVSTGMYHTCGATTGGAVACWGHGERDKRGGGEFGQAGPPGGTFTQVNAGGFHTCGVTTDGAVACWGNDGNGQATPPGGTFTQVSVGYGNHTCGVKTDDTVACWGNDGNGQATPPGGTFVQVSAGSFHTCGVKTDREVVCWGLIATAPSGTFQQVSAGGSFETGSFTCGVKADGGVACWDDGRGNEYGQATPPGGSFTQVSAGDDHTCGVRVGGEVACWGSNENGKATPPGGTFHQVSSSLFHTCGVRVGGAVVCWGNESYQLPSGDKVDLLGTPPGGTFAQVSADKSWGGCGVKTDGQVVCWGNNNWSNKNDAPVGTFVQVASRHYACGVTTDGVAACWGEQARGIVLTDDNGIAVSAAPAQPAVPPLGNPTNLQAVVGSGQVNLTWEPASNADTHWILRYKISNGAETLEDTLQVSGTAASATVTGLEDGQSYVFVVIASRQVSGEIIQRSQPSNRAPVTLPAAQPPPDPLGKPTNVAAVADGSEVTVTWTDAPGAVRHLAMLLKADFSGAPLSGMAAGSSHTFSEVPAGSYIAVVVAFDASGKYQFGISAVVTVGAPPASEDRAALVALYRATGGSGWANNQRNDGKWLVDDPNSSISEWYGVTTDDNGRVTKLELQGNNLVGSVPENLKLLTALELLRLEENDLSGCMPKSDVLNNALEWGRHQWRIDAESRFASHRGSEVAPLWEFVLLSVVLQAAEEIGGSAGKRIAKNRLSPSLSLGLPPCAPQPPLPSKWVDKGSQTTKTDAMALLDIYNYYVGGGRNPRNPTTKFDDGGGWGQNGSFMTYVNNAEAAACPDANPFAGIHGVKTKEINGCHRVTSLSLDKRGLNGEIPSDIARLWQLKFLNLSQNNLTGPIPAELGLLSKLHTLALNNNRLVGEIPEELGNLFGGSVDRLLISGDLVLDLYLQENYLDGTVPLELANIPHLRSIRIDPQYYVSNGVRHSKDLEGCLPPNLELDAYGVLPKALTTLASRSFDKVRDGVKILRTPSERSLDALTNELLSKKRIQRNRANAIRSGRMTEDEYDKHFRDLTGKVVDAGLKTARLADEHGFWDKTAAFSLQAFVVALDVIDYYAEQIKNAFNFITELIGAALGAGNREDVACD